MKVKTLLAVVFMMLICPAALAHGWHHNNVRIGLIFGVPLYYGYNYYPEPVIYTANPPINNYPTTVAYSPRIYQTATGLDYVYVTYYPQTCTTAVTTFHHANTGRIWYEIQRYSNCE